MVIDFGEESRGSTQILSNYTVAEARGFIITRIMSFRHGSRYGRVTSIFHPFVPTAYFSIKDLKAILGLKISVQEM
jgi:hypothetical protein